MTHFLVSVYEVVGDPEPIYFACWADDEAHAIEQAENAYPDGKVVSVAHGMVAPLEAAIGEDAQATKGTGS